MRKNGAKWKIAQQPTGKNPLPPHGKNQNQFVVVPHVPAFPSQFPFLNKLPATEIFGLADILTAGLGFCHVAEVGFCQFAAGQSFILHHFFSSSLFISLPNFDKFYLRWLKFEYYQERNSYVVRAINNHLKWNVPYFCILSFSDCMSEIDKWIRRHMFLNNLTNLTNFPMFQIDFPN